MSVDQQIAADVERVWADDILPALQEYITIPNVSAAFDPNWDTNGHMARAVELVRAWCAGRQLADASVEIHQLPGLTPLLLVDVPAANGGPAGRTVLLYGHLDKQPEMEGWRDGLGPWTPVIEGDRLYGRGGADDGYAAFASLTAIEAARRAGLPHARCLVLIEASEESGSPDLPAYLEHLADRIGTPELVLCLDSGCLDSERLWVTTSLRGLVAGTVTVEVLTEGVHSGEASGVVPSSFRIMRQLLDRLEDATTGRLLLPELHVEVPADRLAEAELTARNYGSIAGHFPTVAGLQPMVADAAEQLLARTWRPALSYTGVAGIAPVARAGNVLRPSTSLQLSFRLPPTCDHDAALAAIERAVTSDPPSGAHVTFSGGHAAPGWNAPPFAPWLTAALTAASEATFGTRAEAFGEGGTIPFMGMLGTRFPAAQFVVTGALGPGSNAHGPNEFLHLPTARHVTACLTHLLAHHAAS